MTHDDRVAPYEVAEVRFGPDGIELQELPLDHVAELLKNVIDKESPIHVTEAARRLANASGLERVGNRILAKVLDASEELQRRGSIYQRGDFLWTASTELGVRDRSEAPFSLRDIELIAPEEIRLAAARLGHRPGAVVEDALIVGTSRLLGFRRTGKDVFRVIRSALMTDQPSQEYAPQPD